MKDRNSNFGDPGNPGLGNLSASHPYSTNQEPAAPSLEQLEKDAARYRWLRNTMPLSLLIEVFDVGHERDPEDSAKNRVALDAEIDAAICWRAAAHKPTSSPDKT